MLQLDKLLARSLKFLEHHINVKIQILHDDLGPSGEHSEWTEYFGDYKVRAEKGG